MDITPEVVNHIASLARIEIDQSEVQEYQDHLQKVLKHMTELSEVNTDGIDPMFSPVFDVINEIQINSREDEVKPSWSADEVIANAPKYKQNQFLVEAVIDEN